MSRHIVIEGNLTRDPNGGYGKDTGKAYAHLDIAVTDRTRNNQRDWVDGPEGNEQLFHTNAFTVAKKISANCGILVQDARH